MKDLHPDSGGQTYHRGDVQLCRKVGVLVLLLLDKVASKIRGLLVVLQLHLEHRKLRASNVTIEVPQEDDLVLLVLRLDDVNDLCSLALDHLDLVQLSGVSLLPSGDQLI